MATNFSRRGLLIGGAIAVPAAVALTQSRQAAAASSLSGKSILVTGAASGFGNLGALHYARQGAKVIATMRNLPRAEAAALRDTGVRDKLDLHIVEIDVLSEASVTRGVAEAERIAGGAIDVLVNNAGIGIGGPAELQDEAATRLIFDTNVFGYQRMMRAVLPGMRAAKSGLIVNVSSQLGRFVIPNFGLYPATKFAVEALSEQSAAELQRFGIDVSIIEPGGYPTAIWAKSRARTAELVRRTPAALREAYGIGSTSSWGSDGGSTDPMDVPRAIAEIIAMAPGTRPLRRPVHG
jgi:NAD(P)-dependent dehydrogenase (short-subunit alcohol dehydrogenase family)